MNEKVSFKKSNPSYLFTYLIFYSQLSALTWFKSTRLDLLPLWLGRGRSEFFTRLVGVYITIISL